MNKAVSAILLIHLLAGISQAEELITKPLFFIQRSKNANIVRYDAQLNKDGTLNSKEPVIAYWILQAEDGRREPLNLLERTKAYGFDIQSDGSGTSYHMKLAAFPKREIRVYTHGDGVKAVMVINGKPAYLEKVFIDSKEGLVLPTVLYVELFGTDVSTGEKRYEKILP